MKEPVLVSSVDGVGTKLKVAFAMGRHDTSRPGPRQPLYQRHRRRSGRARSSFSITSPAGKLEPDVFKQLLGGFAKACKAGQLRPDRRRDGANARHVSGGANTILPARSSASWTARKCLTAPLIRPGDVLIGLLLKRACIPTAFRWPGASFSRIWDSRHPHGCRSFAGRSARNSCGSTRTISRYFASLRARPGPCGAAHITGGGLTDNLPRVLPRALRPISGGVPGESRQSSRSFSGPHP